MRRVIYEGEDATGVDQPHLARFGGVTITSGTVDEPVEALLGRFDVADAAAELSCGAELLVWIRPTPEEHRYANVVALGPDGEAVFLGDCIPAWTPAFARYVDRSTSGAPAAELLTQIVAEPTGLDAVAFGASDEAQTLAGPLRG